MRQIWYHGGCHDGFAAAWVFWKVFGGEGKYVPVSYGGDIPPFATEDEIWIVDFSFKRTELEIIKKNCKGLRVLDHHKTAAEELAGLDYCRFDMAKSGAVLAWEELNDLGPPLQILLIQDRDLWQFKYDKTKPFSAGLRLLPMDFEIWDAVFGMPELFQATVSDGFAVLKYEKMLVERLVAEARMLRVGEYLVPVVNATAVVSELGNELLEKYPDAKFSCSYRDCRDGKQKWSLRSRSDFDCSVVAKTFGGGGHAQACGFETKSNLMFGE